MKRPFRNKDATLRRMLTNTRIIAIVGASDKEDRPANEVMKFLLDHGYRIIPINPRLRGQELLGQKVLASLKEVPQLLLELRQQEPTTTIPSSSNNDTRTNQASNSVPGAGIMVDIFRRSDCAGEIVDQAIALGHDIVSSIWMQIGVIDENAAHRALAAGLDVAMNTCPVEEMPRLGIDTRITATTGTVSTGARKRTRRVVERQQGKVVVSSKKNDESTNPSWKGSRRSKRKK